MVLVHAIHYNQGSLDGKNNCAAVSGGEYGRAGLFVVRLEIPERRIKTLIVF
jgi:hypothetical protein